MNLSPDRPLASRTLRTLAVAGGLTLVTFGAAFGAFGSLAQAEPPPHPHGPPPPEAFTACESKASGDVCSVSMHGHDMTGKCDTPPGESRLACRPDRPPPPPQAFTACESKASGDACTVQLQGATVNGKCDAPPGESRLACHPEGCGHDGPPPAAPGQ